MIINYFDLYFSLPRIYYKTNEIQINEAQNQFNLKFILYIATSTSH